MIATPGADSGLAEIDEELTLLRASIRTAAAALRAKAAAGGRAAGAAAEPLAEIVRPVARMLQLEAAADAETLGEARASSATPLLARLRRGLGRAGLGRSSAAHRLAGPGTYDAVAGSGLFSASYYRTQTPRTPAADALEHYLREGERSGLRPNRLFDPVWYLYRYSDVERSGLGALFHYAAYGWKEKRLPNPWFDSAFYLDRYPDVAAAGTNPLRHYMAKGWREGRQPGPKFDPAWYRGQHPWLADAGIDLLAFHIAIGTRLELSPNAEAAKWRRGAAPRRADPAAETPPLRIGYVLWDFPALSQTFVLNELRWLVSRGHDVRVYYRVEADVPAELDFAIAATQVETSAELAELLAEDGRTLLHAHFAYPATTLLAWPAARRAQIPFLFAAHAIDIIPQASRRRNRIGEVAADPLCLGVVTPGAFNRDLLLECGVAANRIVMERQAVSLAERPRHTMPQAERGRPCIVAIGRYVEKKGFSYLLEAAAELPEAEFVIHGFGPLEEALRQQSRELGLQNVTFAGALKDRAALDETYAGADLVAVPSVAAANGDMDALPTVILEAMAAGVPVVTTGIANIPDLVVDRVTGFLAPPRNASALAEAIRTALRLDPPARRRLIETARRIATAYASTDRLMATLTDAWRRRSVDIVLVTYDIPAYDDWETTRDIIDRLYRFTAMPFNLIVVDNASQPRFRQRIVERYGGQPNFSFVPLPENIFVGPATNLGIERGSSGYVIYVCSKEGFVLQSGWERRMVEAMDANPRAAMGGYLIRHPKYRNGADYQAYPGFEKWRNRRFAAEHPARPFRHLQGGFLILRRSAYDAVGGFSTNVPQAGTDVEFSYYLESCGYELADIPDIYSISSATQPRAHTLIDENALAVHPLDPAKARRLDLLARRQAMHCNLCGWQGERFAGSVETPLCPGCNGTPFERSAMRFLSLSGELQWRPRIIAIGQCAALRAALSTLCSDFAAARPKNAAEALAALRDAVAAQPGLLILDHLDWEATALDIVADLLTQHASAGGRALIGENRPGGLIETLALRRPPLSDIAFVSRCGGYDVAAIGAIGFAATRGAIPLSEIGDAAAEMGAHAVG